jgi:class 3 adenylate cyclase
MGLALVRRLAEVIREPDRGTLAFGIGSIYRQALVMANATAFVGFAVIMRLIAGHGFHLFGTLAIGVASAFADLAIAVLMLRPTLRWFAAGSIPTPAQRGSAVAVPMRHTVVHAGVWAELGTAVLILHLHAGHQVIGLTVAGIVLAGAASSFAGYLAIERILRPVFIVALAGAPPSRRPRHGVAGRLLATWALFTGVPLAAVTVIMVAQYIGPRFMNVADGRAPALASAVIGIVGGLAAMTLAARSVADPLRDVTKAMGRIALGDVDARTDVYDISEIGALQTGFNAMAAAVAERERLHDLFGIHVGRDVARHALRGGSHRAGDLHTAAVLFIDLAGSTAFADTNPPDRVAELLNDFFQLVVTAVDSHGGFVNKFEGDAALAIFGAPVPIDDPAGAALAAARSLCAALRTMPSMLDFGIGISYGKVFAGNIGAEHRYEYTVIGDVVNQSARLSDLAKTRPSRVIATSEAVAAAEEREAVRWYVAEPVTLRGRATATPIAEPAT